ncbi:MAG: diguanylate cyclase [Geminicoccaceae bacterium]|nr:diguanylate cyclase [Geminicoccaceae bacterium]
MQTKDGSGSSADTTTVATRGYGLQEGEQPYLRLVEVEPELADPLLLLMSRRQPVTVRILIVDHDEADFYLVRQLLERAVDTRFEIEWARNGDAALRKFKNTVFDVCLVEYRLPGIDGLMLARQTHALGHRLPIILMSGEPDENTGYAALELGLADYLDKEELEVDRLERRIRFALARESGLGRLGYLCHFDELTGLANRTLLNDRFARALAASRRHHTRTAVIVVDLNGFKTINDTHGHAAGDRVLKAIAERLGRCLRETDTVSRIGGDEFVLLVENLRQTDDVVVVAVKALEMIRQPVYYRGCSIDVSAALGVSIYPDDAGDPPELLRLADTAMYRAKRQAIPCCRFHDRALDRKANDDSLLECDLQEAIRSGSLSIEYTLQRRLDNAGEMDMDAVITWPHPEFGLLPCSRFSRLAEQGGLVEMLTEWMIDTAITQMDQWCRQGNRHRRITLPLLSRRQLAWNAIVDRITARLDAHGIARDRIELAIDEHLLLDEMRAGGETFGKFAQSGLRIAVAEFGSHTGSLTLLRDAPLQTIRLARELLEHAAGDRHRRMFVDATIGLARRLGYAIVAPDVDEPAVLDMLACYTG